jgi:hypothetical protein
MFLYSFLLSNLENMHILKNENNIFEKYAYLNCLK